MEFLTSWAHANAIVVSAVILIVAYIFIATEKIPNASIELSQNPTASTGAISRKRTIAKNEQFRSAPDNNAETGAGASE